MSAVHGDVARDRRFTEPRPAPPVRVRWGRVAALLAVVAILAVGLGELWPASSPSSSSSTVAASRGGFRHDLGPAGGAVPDGTTVFDDGVPAVARLDARLRQALRQAVGDAGLDFVVNSGWRSPAYQEQLLQEAVAKYGTREEAARWVATPRTSAHVGGDAVDLASSAAGWLAEHGAAYGLCRVYANEPWHYELRPQAAAAGCPAPYPDPTHDPRMQR